MDTIELNKLVNKSGFPFQIAIKNLIDKTTEKHNWKVIKHEEPWNNTEADTKGYVDIIVNKGIAKLIIECKRVLNSNWVFLTTSQKTDFESYYALRVNNNNQSIGHATWQKFYGEPRTHKSEYCVFEGRDRSLIESNVSLLVDAIETYALVDIDEVQNKKAQKLSCSQSFYLPVIVTTANLFVSQFEADKVDLKDGKIEVDKNTFTKIDIVKFEKTIKTVKTAKGNIYSANGIVTCFIVSVDGLLKLLENLSMRPDDVWTSIT